MSNIIKIDVKEKIAKRVKYDDYIVCDNKDYVIEFSFDEEWENNHAKTAIFTYKQGNANTSEEVVFAGNVCEVPSIINTTKVEIGVYAGDLRTTTNASIPCKKSALSNKGLPPDPTPDVYTQILEKIDSGALRGKDGKDGSKLVSQSLQGQDENGGNVYLQTYNDGLTTTFVAPMGKQGAVGLNGITPVLRINKSTYEWEASYDNGVSWASLGFIAKGQDGEKGESGQDGLTPYIGANGNWFIGEKDTGVQAKGQQGAIGLTGEKGDNGITPHIGTNGNWYLAENDTGVKAKGQDGINGSNGLTPYIGTNGNWYIGNTDTGVYARGKDGEDGIGISKITTEESYEQDEYTVTPIVIETTGNVETTVKAFAKNGTNGVDGVGISEITSGESYEEGDNTITPITFNKTDNSKTTINVYAKNGKVDDVEFPVATRETFGGVKVGDTLQFDENNSLNTSPITYLDITTGNTYADGIDEGGIYVTSEGIEVEYTSNDGRVTYAYPDFFNKIPIVAGAGISIVMNNSVAEIQAEVTKKYVDDLVGSIATRLTDIVEGEGV